MRFLLILLCIFNFGLFAQESENAKINKLASEVDQTKKKLIRDEKDQRKLLSSLYSINQKMKSMTEKRSTLSSKVYAAEARVSQLARSIVLLENKVDSERDGLSKRLRTLYMLKGQGTMRIIFGSQSGQEFDKNLKYLKILSERDYRVIKNFEQSLLVLKGQREKLKVKVAKLLRSRKSLKKQKKLLHAQQSSKTNLLKKLRKTRKQYEVRLKGLRQKSKVLISDNIGNEVESLLKPTFFEQKGKLQLPAVGLVSEPFGVIEDEDFGFQLMHKGVFITSPRGSEVKTVFSGEVIFKGNLPGYGEAVLIDHSDNYYTVYTFLEGIEVKLGQKVEPQQVIAAAGYNKERFEPGIYFELRHFSEAIDPMGWFQKGRRIKQDSTIRMPPMMSLIKKAIGIGALTIVLLGVILATPVGKSFAKERYLDLQLFAKVLNYVQQYYVEEIDTKKLIYGGIKGMLKELDPHTNFLPPEIYKEFESETSGEFGGLGIEITLQNGILTVISPIEDTPAWKAGLKSGDKIVEVNGESTKGLSLVEAAQKMKGKKGSVVKLGIFREGFEEPQVFSIKRGVVRIRSVKYTDLSDGYAYLRLTSFIENTAKDIKKFVKKHRKNNNKNLKGMVIDLRRNPGGLLDQAVQISDLFLEKGTIVSTIGRNKKEKEVLYAKKPGTYENFPIVIIIDEYSASASEILAGALQDNKRALIMGQRSFGKGSVQSVVKLGDGSGLKLTVARYYTPSGRSIQSEGIVPDVIVDNLNKEVLEKAKVKRKVKREKDIQGHLLGEKEAKQKSKKKKTTQSIDFWWAKESSGQKTKLTPQQKLLANDFQVLQAYNYLKAWDKIQGFSSR